MLDEWVVVDYRVTLTVTALLQIGGEPFVLNAHWRSFTYPNLKVTDLGVLSPDASTTRTGKFLLYDSPGLSLTNPNAFFIQSES